MSTHLTDILQADLVHHPMNLTMPRLVIDILLPATEVYGMVFRHLLMGDIGHDHAHHSHIEGILKIIKYTIIQDMVKFINEMLIEYIASL